MLFIICDTSQESNTRHADQSDQKQNVGKKLKASSFLDLSNYFSKYASKERQRVTLSDVLLLLHVTVLVP